MVSTSKSIKIGEEEYYLLEGRIKAQKKSICQDYSATRKIQDGVILCVADGHGSKACPRSDVGARFAVEIFLNISQALPRFSKPKALIDSIKSELVIAWKNAVDIHFKNHPLFEPEGLRPSQLALLQGPAEAPDRDLAIRLLYGSTLVGAVITTSFIFFFQLGDGNIIRLTDSPKFSLEGKDGLGNETNSLCMANAFKHIETELVMFDDTRKMPEAIQLSTDGYANAFARKDGLLRTITDYQTLLSTNHQDVASNLTSWLQDASDNGSGDDISLVGLYKYKHTEVPEDSAPIATEAAAVDKPDLQAQPTEQPTPSPELDTIVNTSSPPADESLEIKNSPLPNRALDWSENQQEFVVPVGDKTKADAENKKIHPSKLNRKK